MPSFARMFGECYGHSEILENCNSNCQFSRKWIFCKTIQTYVRTVQWELRYHSYLPLNYGNENIRKMDDRKGDFEF